MAGCVLRRVKKSFAVPRIATEDSWAAKRFSHVSMTSLPESETNLKKPISITHNGRSQLRTRKSTTPLQAVHWSGSTRREHDQWPLLRLPSCSFPMESSDHQLIRGAGSTVFMLVKLLASGSVVLVAVQKILPPHGANEDTTMIGA